MTVAIDVQGLSKRYHVSTGASSRLPSTLAEELHRLGRRLFRPPPSPPPGNAAEFWALRDISFKINKGEIVGVLGRNGAGKSTLLKILSRVVRPTAGRARIVGRVGSLLEVGAGFHPELTGRENVFLYGAVLGMRKSEITRKFDQIETFAEIEDFLDVPIKRYSSGMYMRLAFSVAAHLDPDILIIDEALGVGDMTFQSKCLAKVEEIVRDTDRTVIVVSHNSVMIERLCSRSLVLHQGSLVFDGEVQKALSYYRNAGSFCEDQPGRFRLPDLVWQENSLLAPPEAHTTGPFQVQTTYRISPAAWFGPLRITYYAASGPQLGSPDDIVLGRQEIEDDARKSPGDHVCESGPLLCGRPGDYYVAAVMETGAEPGGSATRVLMSHTRIRVTGPVSIVVDNEDSGYADTGPGWLTYRGPSYGGTLRYSLQASGENSATWQVSGLPSGQYAISTTWQPHPNRATDVSYGLYDGVDVRAVVKLNQKRLPHGPMIHGFPFQYLSTVTVASGLLRIRVSDAANGCVVADAVWLQQQNDSQGRPESAHGPDHRTATPSAELHGPATGDPGVLT